MPLKATLQRLLKGENSSIQDEKALNPKIPDFEFAGNLNGFRGAGGIPIDYGEAGKPIPGPNASNGAMVAFFWDFALKIFV